MTCLDVATAAQLRPGPVRDAEHAFHCPKHEDEHASLLINTSKNCWMCGPCGAKGTAWQLAAFLAHVQPSDKPAVLAWLSRRGLMPGNGAKPAGNGRQIVAKYPYTDEAGNLLF